MRESVNRFLAASPPRSVENFRLADIGFPVWTTTPLRSIPHLEQVNHRAMSRRKPWNQAC
jgi:hypothetical protein